MANNQLFVQTQPFQLAGSGSSIGDVSIIVKNFNKLDGTALAMTDFGSKGFGTLEPGAGAQEEPFTFTGVTNNGNSTSTLSGVKYQLPQSPYTETSGLTIAHPGGATMVITNTAGFYDRLTSQDDDETITGDWTFSNFAPTIPTQLSSDIHRAASIEYVNAVAIAGAPNASTTVRGIVQEATQAQTDARTTAGSTTARLFLNPGTLRSALRADPVADTGAANAYAIAPSPAFTAYTTGMVVGFIATNSNTTTSTLNVNALGTKTIFKVDGATNLSSGDIKAAMYVEAEYTGSAFQMTNPVGNTPATVKFGGTGADGALTITSGTTTLPLGGVNLFVKNYTSISITGTGKLAFSGAAAGGTIIVLKSQGGVTITSSTVPCIDASGMGAAGGAGTASINASGAAGTAALDNLYITYAAGTGGAGNTNGGGGGAGTPALPLRYTSVVGKIVHLATGAGGASGGNATNATLSGAGGAGGAALYIECAGALNFTTAGGISVAGATGGTPATNTHGSGGGGGAGSLVLMYNTLTAASGTVTVSGGAAGSGSAAGSGGGGGGGAGTLTPGTGGAGGGNPGTGGVGGTGLSIVQANTEFA